MATIVTTFIVFLLIVGAMAVGVLMGRKPIAGSCGGMGALGMVSDCEICGGDRSKCDSEKPAANPQGNYYNAADSARTD